MTNDEIRAFLDRFVLLWSRSDVIGLGACYAEECTVISPIFSTITGREQVERSYRKLFDALAKPVIRVDDIVIGQEGAARAAMICTVESTHVGEMFGTPATGKQIERTIAYILTLQDGLIVKEVRIYDFTSMLIKLGVLRAKPA